MGRKIQIVAFEKTRVVKRSTLVANCPICLSSDGLVTSAEAAALLKVGEPSIRRWLSQGRAHGFKTPGGQYRICRKSLFQRGANFDVVKGETD
jgi:excisionase family DNA binding protein